MDLKRLTHPEYLSDQELREILQTYHVCVPHDMPRCGVLDLFKKTAQPLDQREKVFHNEDGRCLMNKSNKNGLIMSSSKINPMTEDLTGPVTALRDQFYNTIRIGSNKDDLKPMHWNSTNFRKRLSSLLLQPGNFKTRKLSEQSETGASPKIT